MIEHLVDLKPQLRSRLGLDGIEDLLLNIDPELRVPKKDPQPRDQEQNHWEQ